MDNPFRLMVKQWLEKIKLASEYKKKAFQDDADECMKFFNGPYDFLYQLKYSRGSGSFIYTGGDGFPRPSFAMTVNKCAELVQIFGPVLYHRNPNRKVTPRQQVQIPIEMFGDPNDPMVQEAYMPLAMQAQQAQQIDNTRSELLSTYLNYTPNALDLKVESRKAIDEALIKGMGLLWHEIYRPRGAPFKYVGSFYGSVDDILIDPDAENLYDAKWIARRCRHPVWEVERRLGYERGKIKGNCESSDSASKTDGKGEWDRRRGVTNDLLCYWKVWSKMGMGGHLSGAPKESKELDDFFGDFVYLEVCDTMDYPLNVPEPIWEDVEAIQESLQWETPFWADDAWPMTPLSFHWVPGQVWPMSHLKPGLGELKAINWIHSFLMSKVKNNSRDLIALAEDNDEEVRRALVQGLDFEIIKLKRSQGQKIGDMVQFLQYPTSNPDIWKWLLVLNDAFEKRTGLTELMYGTTRSAFRSATEADVKADQLSIRPDDMAQKVEDAMSDVARREGLMARWHLEPEVDIAPVMGPQGAQLWAQVVAPTDPGMLLHSLEYRVEAGTAKKPNKDKDVGDANAAMQNLFQPMFELAMTTGQVGPVNALITKWCKANDMEAGPFLVNQPPPPPDPTMIEEEQAAAEMNRDDAAHEQEMKQKAEKHKLDMKIAKEKASAQKAAIKKKGAA